MPKITTVKLKTIVVMIAAILLAGSVSGMVHANGGAIDFGNGTPLALDSATPYSEGG